jgi:hypothetical protein
MSNKDKNKDKPKTEEIAETKKIIDGDKPGGDVPPKG